METPAQHHDQNPLEQTMRIVSEDQFSVRRLFEMCLNLLHFVGFWDAHHHHHHHQQQQHRGSAEDAKTRPRGTEEEGGGRREEGGGAI